MDLLHFMGRKYTAKKVQSAHPGLLVGLARDVIMLPHLIHDGLDEVSLRTGAARLVDGQEIGRGLQGVDAFGA